VQQDAQGHFLNDVLEVLSVDATALQDAAEVVCNLRPNLSKPLHPGPGAILTRP
jgi:hypothetical protein